MYKNKQLWLGALALTLFAACSEDPGSFDNDNPSDFIRIGASTLSEDIATRTPYDGTNSISASHPLAAFVPVSKTDGNYAALYTDASGNRGTKITWQSGSATLFDVPEYSYPTNGDPVYMVGLAPYDNWAASVLTTTATSSNPIDGKTDLMVAPQISGKNTDRNKTLKFAHLGTKLNILVKAASAQSITHWGTITGIQLTQADGALPPTKATATLKTGAATWVTSGAATLNAYKYDGTTYTDTKLTSATLSTTAKAVAYVIAPAITVAGTGDYVLHVTATGSGGQSVYADIPVDVALPAGATATTSQGYAFNITLNFTGGVTSGDIVVGSEVADWNEGTDVNAPSANTTVYLSSIGTSNCYIVNATDTKYIFDATVMGNGVIPESQKGVITSAKIAKNAAYKAVVLWSTGTSITSIVQNVVYDSNSGKITFNTPAKSSMPGNAVIALEDGTGKILWSWHIWRTSYIPGGSDLDTYAYNVGDSIKGNLKMMKYNLGATQLATTLGANAYESGLLYQWGRKDPFLGGKGNIQDASKNEPVKGEDYFISTAVDFTSKLITADGASSVTTAIANPLTFYLSQSGGDWLASGSAAIIKNNDIWGNPGSISYKINKEKGAKSMFDPCPPGYMVPPVYTWYKSKTYSTDGTYSLMNNGMVYKNGIASAFYALAGYRDSNTGKMLYIGVIGNAWQSSPTASNNSGTYNLYFNNGAINPLTATSRGFGEPVRCCIQ